jgi:peptidoglycan/xylan/chitin deacetylase (PgdA/CDA1 family)
MFIHFQKKINSYSFPTKYTDGDSTQFALLKEYLNSDLFKASKNDPGVEKNIAKHNYQMELSLNKQNIINVWRNGDPVITKQIRENGTVPLSIPLDYGENTLKILALDPLQSISFQQNLKITYRNPHVELFRKSIQRGSIDRKRIAITFDAGSDDSNTLEILQILNDNQLKCTMFLTGKFMQKHPVLVKRMIEDGHEIGNHTYDHPHLTSFELDYEHNLLPGVSRGFIHQQLLETDSIFYSITREHLQPFWRAPFGEYNDKILTWAAEAGYLHIYWTGSFDTHDWVTDESSKLFRTPDDIYDRILAMEEEQNAGLNGVIMLMHLGSHRTENHVYEVLPRLIQTIREKGYALGKISDLLN